MRLKDQISKIKGKIADEEKAAFENLKKSIFNTVSECAENWLRSGIEKVIVYPEVGNDPGDHENKDLMTNINEMEILSPRERQLYGYLVEEEGMAVTSYRYDGVLYIVMDL